MTKLTRSMLEFNVTTPLEKYNKMTGRFGINDESKHVVAEIIYPTGSVGTELLFNVASIADFDVKFSLATPLEFLERILIVGKLKEEEVSQRFDIVSCFYFGLQQPYYKYMLSNSYFKKNSTTVPTIPYLFFFYDRKLQVATKILSPVSDRQSVLVTRNTFSNFR